MDRWTLPVVVTVLSASVLVGPVAVQAQDGAPTGAPYTPPGYSLTVPSGPQVVTTGTTLVEPPQRRPETQSIRELWIPGLVGLPVSYVATWVVASVTLPVGSSAVDYAYIPVLGPWLMLGQGINGGGEEFYATMGVIQGVSLVCLVLGLAIRLPKPAADAPSVSLRPTSSGAMSATLHF
jgi:hypothetical protein